MIKDSRTAFESAYHRLLGTPISVLLNLRDGETYRHTEGGRLALSWDLWQASRKSVCVLVPMKHKASFYSNDTFGPKELASVYNSLRHKVVKSIEANGLTIQEDKS